MRPLLRLLLLLLLLRVLLMLLLLLMQVLLLLQLRSTLNAHRKVPLVMLALAHVVQRLLLGLRVLRVSKVHTGPGAGRGQRSRP
jgi:hypothetical protein